MSREIRAAAAKTRLRERRVEAVITMPSLWGYAARYYDPTDLGTQYGMMPGLVERLAPGCFDAAMRRLDDVRCLLNHNPDMILGRTAAKTCRVGVDGRGLWYEVELPDSPPGHTAAEAVRRGDITGSSFAFEATKVRWTESTDANGQDLVVREILDAELFDVSPVTYPAYTGASVGLVDDDGSAGRSYPRLARQDPLPRLPPPGSPPPGSPAASPLAALRLRIEIAEKELGPPPPAPGLPVSPAVRRWNQEMIAGLDRLAAAAWKEWAATPDPPPPKPELPEYPYIRSIGF